MEQLVVDALWLKEPWLTLVLEGKKTLETRTWGTGKRGTIFLGASRTVDREALEHFAARGVLPEMGPLGHLLGRAVIADSRLMREEDEAAAMCPVTPGRYAWRLVRPARLPRPIPARGQLGIFKLQIPDEFAEEVRTLL